jgi:hypothetical protein
MSKQMLSFPHRLGVDANRKRDGERVRMSDVSNQDILEGITGSRDAAKGLLAEFNDLKGLSDFGSRHGFGRLQAMPGISWAVVGKLEAWLESIGRVTN